MERHQVFECDVIAGGFPCQDISVAGKGAGIHAARSGLWWEMLKTISVLRPRYVVVENVADLINRGLDEVLGSLAEIGYDAQWTTIRAFDFGAPHQRARLFLVAYPHSVGQESGNLGEGGDREEQTRAETDERAPAYAQGIGCHERQPHQSLPAGEGRLGLAGCAEGQTPDGDKQRVERLFSIPIQRKQEFSRFEDVRRVEDLRNRPGIPEPLFRGGRDGVPDWVERIAALGDAVVPACGEYVGQCIVEFESRKAKGVDGNGRE